MVRAEEREKQRDSSAADRQAREERGSPREHRQLPGEQCQGLPCRRHEQGISSPAPRVGTCASASQTCHCNRCAHWKPGPERQRRSGSAAGVRQEGRRRKQTRRHIQLTSGRFNAESQNE